VLPELIVKYERLRFGPHLGDSFESELTESTG
jgi:hypothetical protein